MVKEYLNTLKSKGNYTYEDISNLSNIPVATIRKVMSGDTADPRFDTVAKLVTAMGGSMDNILSEEKEEEIEVNAIAALKEVYESRIADIKEHIQSLKRDKRFLAIAAGVLMAFVVFLLVLDLSIGSRGWIQY